MRKRLVIWGILILGLASIYLNGPKPQKPVYSEELPQIAATTEELEMFVRQNEEKHLLKPENEAEIVWADTAGQVTEFAIVYLHGFSASKMEGDPLHRQLAEYFGANLFLTRLHPHGVDTSEALVDLTAENLWHEAQRSLVIGQKLGKKVVLVSTSTGGTLALMLAAKYPDRIHGLINLSPNIRINDPTAFLLNDPWGKEIASLVLGGKYRTVNPPNDQYPLYWNDVYRIEAITELQNLIETSMNEATFGSITVPVFTGCYYRDEENQDPVVRVDAMEWMMDKIATPDSLKRMVYFDQSENHVLGSKIVSKHIEIVRDSVISYAEEVLKMNTEK